jgi:hypothetical protein
LSRTADAIGADGGRLSVTVTTLTGCSWTAASTANWISIQSGQSGNANGTVSMTVSANAGGERTGQVTIAGQPYTVVQSGADAGPPSPSLPPPPQNTPPAVTPVLLEFSGSVQSVSGRCPTITFEISGRTVVTNGATDFVGLKCTDVKKKARLTIDGATQADGSILAAQIRRSDNNN